MQTQNLKMTGSPLPTTLTNNDGISVSFVATECMVDQFAHLTSISFVEGILPLHPTSRKFLVAAVPGCALTGGGSRDAIAACHV